MSTSAPVAAPARGSKFGPLSVIVRNVTSNWAGIVVGAIVAFVLAPVTVRGLGDDYYGIWTLLMQFTGYLWLFDLGVRESVIKYVAQYEAVDDRPQIVAVVGTAVTIYGLVSLVTLLITLGLAFALPYVFNLPASAVATARLTTVFVGATVAQYFVFNVFIGVLMALQKFHQTAQLNIVFTLLRGAIVYVMMTSGYGLVALAAVQFSLALVSNLIVLRLCKRALPYLPIGPRWPARADVSRLLHYGKYVLISNIGDKVIFATDSIIIGIFLPISALTYYAIGGSLIEQFRGFITSMAALVNPMSSSLQARREEQAVATVVTTGVRAAVLIGLPVAVGFVVLGSRFIAIWMGPEYAGPSGQVLAVLTIGHLLGLPYYTMAGALYGLGRHRVVAQTRIFEAVMNLGLSLVLVRRLGLVGVALGTVIPHVIVVVGLMPPVLARWVPIRLRHYYRDTYVRPLMAAAPFALACWWIATRIVPADFVTFFAAVGVALVAYALPAWWVALSSEERVTIGGMIRRRWRSPRAIEGVS